MRKRVADIIIETLAENNIVDCFAVVGGGAMHLNNALALNNNVKTYFNHHEQSCAMAADAYARVSGQMAAVCVTSGPGTTNIMTGVMGAYQDSLPMIVISGQVRYATTARSTGLPLRYRGVQEFDVVPTVESMTKYAKMITEPYAIKKEVIKAINLAMQGRRGPVWLDIPLDIQSQIIEADMLQAVDELDELPSITNEECSDIVKAIASSKRPCILGGTGIVSSNNQNRFLNFVEKVGIPTIGGGWCTDMLHTNHDLYFGLSGDIGPRTGNFILQNSDLILVLGNSLSFRQTGFAQEKFAPKAKIIFVDVDEYEAKKPGIKVEKFIHSDLNNFFEMFEKVDVKIDIAEEWITYCKKLKKHFSIYESIEGLKMDERVNSYYFWKEYNEFAKEGNIIAMGNSRANAAKIQIGVEKKNQRAITNYLCGSMGYELPAAIGCAVASQKEVYCITGDGSIMMNLQELHTIVQCGLNVKVVVFANEGYEAIRQTCKNFFSGTYFGCDAKSGVTFPEFRKIAMAFGYEYKSCDMNADVHKSLEWLFSTDGPCFLEVKQQLENPLIPKVMSRMLEDGSFETPALHDMAPFLNEDELKKWMISEE